MRKRNCRSPAGVVGAGLALVAAGWAASTWLTPTGSLAVARPEGGRPALAALEPLQPLIDAAQPGAIVTPTPGRYRGPVLITKPITLDGNDQVTIDGLGKGTILTLKTDGATVRNLRVTSSGDQHNDIDAGIRIEGNFNVVKDTVVEESLFGIDLQEAHSNVVRRNRISSKGDAALGVKGDAIRLWYSRNNRLEDNTISGSRDLVMWYSEGNTLARNQVTHGRYGLHLMYARNNVIEDNIFDHNAVGIYLMYDEGDIVRRNRVFQALGAAGVGIGFKEASNILVEDNEVLYNAVGLAFDITPFQPGSTVKVLRNRIAFNNIGVSFLSDRPGNVFHDNLFVSNVQHIAMRLYEQATGAEWEGNYWDDYEGFDLDGDGIGDRSHVMRSYADRLWMDVPAAAFFKGSPALTALDFIERLAPFTEPLVLLEDAAPRMSRVFEPGPVAGRMRRPTRASDGDRAHDEDEDANEAPSAPPGLTDAPARLDPFGLGKR